MRKGRRSESARDGDGDAQQGDLGHPHDGGAQDLAPREGGKGGKTGKKEKRNAGQLPGSKDAVESG